MRKTIKQLQGESDYWRVKFINEQQRAEAAEAQRAGAEDRCRIMFDAKNHWADRARAAEARVLELEALLTSQQPADDGWIEWAGGELPVDFNCAVEVKLRSGSSYGGWMAKNFNWNHTGAGLDIIAYRVVKP
ncbi:MAG: hypothetical protein [Bacteriophage sp.]|nr:MAG: hypothetical protein [Bacteriophage sp.]